MDPSINLLRALVTLARTEHFGRAAAELQVPRSTLSERIAGLERMLGVPLVVRTSHAVRLTDLGRQVAARSQTVVDEHERLTTWLSETLTASEKVLRVGVLSGLDRTRITAVLRQARTALPGWAINVHQVGFVNAATLLRAGRIDVALTAGPVDLDAVDVRGREVWHHPRVVMLEAGHRLAARTSVDLADLSGETVIAAGGGRHPLSRAWVVDPRPDGIEVSYGPPARDIEEAVQLVAAGMGINLTASTVADAVTHPGVVFVPLTGAGDASTWVLSRAADRSSAVLAVEELAAEAGRVDVEPRGR